MVISRTKDTPTIVSTDKFDDTNSMGDVSQMYEKLIRPIDLRFRSIATAPGLGTQSGTTRASENTVTGPDEETAKEYLLGQDVDPNNFPESRCHAFYRMLGLPVVSQDGFYNAGHDPNQGSTSAGRSTVNNSLKNKNQELLNLAAARESEALARRQIFARQDEVATGYALLMKYPMRFLTAETGKDPFYIDKQKQTIGNRTVQIESFKKLLEDDSTVTQSLKVAISPSHIIKPMMVIPSIESAVSPGYKKRVCVPFLKDVASTKTTPDITLKRPIIEYIIRMRLKNTESNTLFLDTANRILTNSSLSSDATSSDIKNALLALGGGTVNDDILEGIQGFTTLQAATIVLFTKAIQAAIKELSENIRSYNELITAHFLQPIPNVNGPEFGGSIRTVGGIQEKSEIDIKIATMELTKLLAQMRSTQSDSQVGNESVYASAIAADLHKDFDTPIKKLKAERDRNGARAINNLKVIEVVTGEISGFGLIDILAFYTALWAIDMKDLLGLLDNNSLSRLKENFPALVPPGSEAREQLQNANRDIQSVLSNLESKVFNILTYADSVLDKQRSGPRRARKGTV